MDKVLFWDFHGTLTYPDKLWSVNVYKAAQDILPGCNITLEQVIDCLDNDGFPWHHPERTYLDITSPELWWEYINKLFYTTYLRCGLTSDEAKLIIPYVKERILDKGNYRLYEQAEETLKELKETGWRHIMLSNNFPELKEICINLGIAKYFNDFVVSALEGYDKPRKEIFDIALEKAGYPEICYMIGDNPVSDIEGAKNAGIKSILINNITDCCADHSVKAIYEIVEILKDKL